MSSSDRESILDKIADAERQIAGLRQQQKEVEATLRSLRERLSLHVDESPRQATTPAAVIVSTGIVKLTIGRRHQLVQKGTLTSFRRKSLAATERTLSFETIDDCVRVVNVARHETDSEPCHVPKEIAALE